MISRFLVALILAALACSQAPPAQPGADSDPAMGTWVLDIAKSTFDAPPGITSQTVTFAPAPDGGISVTSESVTRTGAVVRSSYTARYDGKRYAISGVATADSVAFARLDARTVERFDTKGGNFVGSVTRVLSPDGKTLTVMNKPMGPQGRTVSVLHYDRR